ncbi:MAG: hypothetical protein CL781_05640 [Chloroflexi bacterium]|nr:hypothetical protein [Chloroflexota bacterium]|tara:strand:+ start:1801 stop:2379 length:579 start_codon:yes stop_codon:yes gene_type:complete
MGGVLRFIASFFKSSNKNQSNVNVLLTVLNITDEQSLTEPFNTDDKSAILLNKNDHFFFDNISSLINESPGSNTLTNSTIEIIEEDEHSAAWLIVKNSSFEDMVMSLDHISEFIFKSGLGEKMTAAVFKSQFRNNAAYLICNYRTARFYPFVPKENRTRHNELEIDIGDQLTALGIPVEPHSNWYALWDIPF